MTAALPAPLDPRAAARWARLAGDAAPWLHEEVARRMAERLPFIRLPVQRWADASPDRAGHARVAAHYPDAACLPLNLVIPAKAGIQTAYPPSGDNQGPLDSLSFPRRREFRGNDEGKVVPRTQAGSGAQAGSAPRCMVLSPKGEREQEQGAIAPGSLHLVWANMLLHQVSEPAVLLEPWRQALAAGGFLMFSCLGPDTLRELRALYRRHGWGEPAQHFADMHDWGDLLLAAGFADPVMDMERITLTFANPERLLVELRELGRNLHPRRFAGLRGRGWRANLLRAMDEELRGSQPQAPLALTFEIVYGHALGAPDRAAVAPRTEVSLAAMRQALLTGVEKSNAAPTKS